MSGTPLQRLVEAPTVAVSRLRSPGSAVTHETIELHVEYSDEPGKPTVTHTYEPTGVVVHEQWHKNGPDSPLHRIGAPAVIDRCMFSGELDSVEYYEEGEPHRVGGPAEIEYDQDGNIVIEGWYKKGQKHRTGSPAIIHRFKEVIWIEEYYQDGFLHRLDGPAKIVRNADNGILCQEAWYIWGLPYRADGGPTSRLYNSVTGALWREIFESVEATPTRAEALRSVLGISPNLTLIDLMP